MSVSYVHPPIERQRVARIRGVKKTNRRVMTFVKKKGQIMYARERKKKAWRLGTSIVMTVSSR